MKHILKIAVIAAMAVSLLTACGKADTAKNKSTTNTTAASRPTAIPVTSGELDPALLENKDNITITFTNGDVIKAEIYPDVAPITVANFEKLINENFYDGLIFHRVIEGFMIQGGGLDENGVQKETDSIKGEFASNGVKNDLKHTRGVLSMARTSIPDSASSQFFIMHEDAPHLDGQYAAFGMVTEGLDVVDKIAAAQTDAQDKPIEPVVIQTITLD